MRTLSVIIPVYFNEGSLPPLFTELEGFERDLRARDVALELIFVNDGSTDGSQAELMRFRERRPATKILQHTRNFGAIAASKTGFRYVTGDAFIVQSADQQDPLAQTLAMVDEWLKGRKFVISVRTERQDPLLTRLFAFFYYKLINSLVLSSYPTGGFDLMLCDQEILPFLRDSDRHVNVNVYAYSLGYEPTVLTYARRRREHGRSRWTMRKKINHLVNTLTGFTAAPIRVFSAFGFLVAFASFAYGGHIAYSAMMGNVGGSGFATLVVLITFFSGLILVMLGILGEYIYRTFERVGRRPEAIVGRAWL